MDVGGASSIAVDAAELVVTNNDLGPIEDAFALSEELHRNLERSLALVSVAPTVLNIAGLLVLRMGLLGSIVVKNLGFAGGMWNAMSPRRGRRSEPGVTGTALRPSTDHRVASKSPGPLVRRVTRTPSTEAAPAPPGRIDASTTGSMAPPRHRQPDTTPIT